MIVFTSEHLGVEHSHGQWCRIMRISYFGIKTNEYKTKEKNRYFVVDWVWFDRCTSNNLLSCFISTTLLRFQDCMPHSTTLFLRLLFALPFRFTPGRPSGRWARHQFIHNTVGRPFIRVQLLFLAYSTCPRPSPSTLFTMLAARMAIFLPRASLSLPAFY